MKRGSCSVLVKFALVSILLTALTSSTQASGIKKRIRFLRGTSSTTISGSVVRGSRDRYILGAKEGQTMTVRIRSAEDNAVFQIYLPGEQESLQGAGEGDDAKSWSGKVPVTIDYVIVVGASRGNARYKLDVKIE